ncbi:sialidase family protein [Luteimonas sp. RD2P54]|uniref:Sialidase family protein n=1 Tax=Luteimonas endophytica TaxID=3042023 RepID=A0ABT6J974_9GAMM|nr:sialidase family protein [Luteimonas endophytica]MDH5823361.1 sialidase family protein [Luteimonas endophytica]
MSPLRTAALAAVVLLAGPAAAQSRPDPAVCPSVEPFAPGVVSDGNWQWRLSFVPDRSRIYWSTSEGWWPGTRERARIMTATPGEDGGWGAPTVAPFSGTHADMDPFVAPDGATLYFSSMRPREGAARNDMDLWMVRRVGDGWSAPLHLGPEVNADGHDELYPSVDRRGNLYFARVAAPTPVGDVDIWRSAPRQDGSYAPARRLGGGVNTPERWEYNPEISPDGRLLLFARLDRPDDALADAGYGWGDLYVARAGHDGFEAAENLGPCVNSAADEYHPTMLWEGGRLYFVRNAGAPGDIHQTRLRLPYQD